MASEMRHYTAGRWTFTRGDVPRVVAGKISICGVHRRGIHTGAFDFRELRANGFLISAAPELYDLAKAFEQSIEYEIARDLKAGDDEGAGLKTITLNFVREAIAKAEGRSQ